MLVVSGGQYLLANILGPDDLVVLVISTLLVVALFQPLRQCVQRLVDRRFYRSKYNAAQVMARYSAMLRDEVGLSGCASNSSPLCRKRCSLLISLWIRRPERTNIPSLEISTPSPATARVDEEMADHSS